MKSGRFIIFSKKINNERYKIITTVLQTTFFFSQSLQLLKLDKECVKYRL